MGLVLVDPVLHMQTHTTNGYLSITVVTKLVDRFPNSNLTVEIITHFSAMGAEQKQQRQTEGYTSSQLFREKSKKDKVIQEINHFLREEIKVSEQ